jgi:peptidoglycan/xylan/chitin deacetylase (PgdA/CDA1 family)
MDVYLNFHGLGEPGRAAAAADRPYWLPPERFEAILAIVRSAPRRARLTFDDGNLSDLRLALPALAKAGLAATFFVTTDRIGDREHLAAGDIRALRAAGMEIGSHGADHVRWTSLTEAALSEQVCRSIEVLSAILGEPVRQLAVPFGDYDGRVLGILRRLGVAPVYTSDGGPSLPGAWLVPRNTVRIDTDLARIRDLLTRRHSLLDRAAAEARQLRRYAALACAAAKDGARAAWQPAAAVSGAQR